MCVVLSLIREADMLIKNRKGFLLEYPIWFIIAAAVTFLEFAAMIVEMGTRYEQRWY